MSDPIKNINILTNKYITIGQELMRRLSVPPIPDSTLPQNISKWIIETTEELLHLMPENCPDYIEIKEIKTHYMNNPSILRSSAKSDICKVLQNLKIAHNCVLVAMNADYKDIPPENLARINHEQLKKAFDFVKEHFIKELKDKENGLTTKTTILNIYGKIYLWVQGMIKLDGPECCLTLAASVRAILELYIDLNMIDKGIIANGVEKYFAFPTVEKWRSAKNIVDIGKKFKLNTKTWDQHLSKQENSDSNIEALRMKVWGKNRKGKPVMPNHWTNLNFRERVEYLNDPNITNIYLSSYYWCSWCVHSMYFDIINDIGKVHLFNWHLYELAYNMFQSATELTNNTINVLPKSNLEDSYRDIENGTFKCFFGEMVNAGRNKKK